ncbi:MAG: hypothetical protein ACREM3_25815 [Candidatus Rokuibacteriota bacterium]
MKKLAALLVLVALVVIATAPSLAWADRGGRRHGVHRHGGHGHRHFHGFRHTHGFRSRVFIGVGPGFVYPYYYYPYYYPPAYYSYTPPPVVVQEPPVYIQQPAQPAPSQPEAYWYYCPGSRAYYPSVQTCAEPWVKVPPRVQ